MEPEHKGGRRLKVLDVEGVVVEFDAGNKKARALDGVSLFVDEGETVAVVGESGCGKTTLARVVLGLQKAISGTTVLAGRTISGVGPAQAAEVGMVWQDPFASLDPRWTVRRCIEEPFVVAKRTGDVEKLAASVGLGSSLLDRYPHQLSGGQRQRVAIGRALALEPKLVICDEPTAALDLSVQAQILNLLQDLKAATNCSFLYISHDLATVQFLADRTAVMYAGSIVEHGPTAEVFQRPLHPYTQALVRSVPNVDSPGTLPELQRGEVPDLTDLPPGCKFAGRCPRAQDMCLKAGIPVATKGLQSALCHFPLESETTAAISTS